MIVVNCCRVNDIGFVYEPQPISFNLDSIDWAYEDSERKGIFFKIRDSWFFSTRPLNSDDKMKMQLAMHINL